MLVVEGSIPRKDQGIYMKLGGRPAIDVLKEVGSKAAAIIAMGSCASWGGVPSADPNPTDAVGVDSIITDKPIVNLSGLPAESVHPSGRSAGICSDGQVAGLRRPQAPQVRL